MTMKAQDISEANRINCAKKKAIHTTGTKSFARNREELREQDPEKKNPHRAVLYIHTHRANSSKNINAHVGDLKDLLVQQPDLADTSQGKVAWKGDALTRILGEEKPGRVHGLGLVPNPDKVLDCSKSGRLKHLNITSLDPTSSEDVVSLRVQVEKLVNHVQNLEQKTRALEQQQNQHGGSGDPLSATTNAQNASIRKRVYVEPPSQEYGMHDGDTLNYTMGEQIDDDGFQDLQSSYKRNYAAEKMNAARIREGNILRPDRVATAHKGGSGDPLSAATNAHNASKRKRVYVEPQSQEYGMHDRDTLNYTMGEQTDDDGFQDLQSSYKRNYAAEKMNAARIREGNLLRADRVATAHKAKPREFQIENRVDNKRANASKGMNKDATSKCSQQINYEVAKSVS
ncbi:uncharacterized protein [Zea mays]|uniref:uncharacterized protein n=1 Tax=Zea mays TaxID=4577 RepID=UPI0016533785|nr:uncharacterized protein LOC118473423 [Zea mays]